MVKEAIVYDFHTIIMKQQKGITLPRLEFFPCLVCKMTIPLLMTNEYFH